VFDLFLQGGEGVLRKGVEERVWVIKFRIGIQLRGDFGAAFLFYGGNEAGQACRVG